MIRLSVLAGLAVLLITAPAPAGAQERICHGQFAPKPPPSKAEKERANLEEWATVRAEFGFRHDIPYVKELVRRGVWEYDVGYIPVTPRENRYLRLRDRLDLGSAGYRYLKRHSDVAAGISVQDDWPREPYLLVRVTRDPARHLAALKAMVRFPDNLRVARARYSERELKRITDRIWRDAKALRQAGFIVTGTSESGDVGLITARTDAAAYFRERYGAGIKVSVEATTEYSERCAVSSTYEISTDGLTLTVQWSSGGSRKPERIELAEFGDRVEVGAVERVPNGADTLQAFGLEFPVTLSAPLDGRIVIDAASGKRLRQVGPSQGEPPCPPPPPEPTRLEEAIKTRQQYGMRADPAYVQQRLNSRSFFTRAEREWVSLLQNLDQGDEETLDADLRAKNKDYAGSVIVARYPATPLVVYRFKRGAAAQKAKIKRRSEHPGSVRVETVDYTYEELEALQNRINEDARVGEGFFDGYGKAGFFSRGAYVDRETGTIVVRVIAARTDHAAYFTARYGPRVRTELVGDRFECPPTEFAG